MCAFEANLKMVTDILVPEALAQKTQFICLLYENCVVLID